MQINRISPDYAVAPQIDPSDLDEVRAAGFATLICNRPDEEVPPDLSSDAMRQAAEARGLHFVLNPVRNGALSEANVEVQTEEVRASAGPVLAYCRSGTRSAMVWALGQAGSLAVDDILSATSRAGYSLDGLRRDLDARASAKR